MGVIVFGFALGSHPPARSDKPAEAAAEPRHALADAAGADPLERRFETVPVMEVPAYHDDVALSFWSPRVSTSAIIFSMTNHMRS